VNTKTNEPAFDVLSKHPDARVPDSSALEEYNTLPDLVEIHITETKFFVFLPGL
jgi:hypothetical protein